MNSARLPRATVTMMVIIVTITHLLTSVMILARPAQSERCKKLCLPPTLTSAHIVIDANTCQILEGTTKFSENEKVQVVFKNKNPFKYQYRFELVSTLLDTAIVTEFVRQIPGLSSITATGGFGQAAGAALCPGQTAVNAANDNFTAKLNAISPLSDKIKTALTPIVAVLDSYNKFVSLTDSDPIPCETACADAEALRPMLGTLTKLGDIPDDVTNIQAEVLELGALFTELESKVNAIPDGPAKEACKLRLVPVRRRLGTVQADVKKYADDVKTLQDNKGSFESLGRTIDRVLADPNPFFEVRYPQTVGGARLVRISIFRKNLRDPNAKETQACDPIELTVGESPLSLSAGVGFSTIPDRKIIRQTANVPDGMGGTKVGAIFGFENNSTFKPSGVIMINGSLRRFKLFAEKDSSLAVSTGLVLSNRNNTTEAEFIAGPSLGLIDNRIFLTFGFHAARVEDLAGGFNIGDPIPDGVNDPLPVERNWKKGFMFSITYKLR